MCRSFSAVFSFTRQARFGKYIVEILVLSQLLCYNRLILTYKISGQNKNRANFRIKQTCVVQRDIAKTH